MNKDKTIRDAIDESLCSVRFNAQDMRSVLRGTRRQPAKPSRAARRRVRRLDFVFAAAMLALVIAPVSLFALRARNTRPVPIASIGEATPDVLPLATPSPEQPTLSPTASPDGDPLLPASAAITADKAIAIARGCFEAQCDTSVFAFEEYAVQASLNTLPNGQAQYTVRMTSIYDNGCSFTVVVSAENGSIVQYSTPKLATQPSYLDSSSEEVNSWYLKNGAHSFTWPQDVQAEFSRRYEGAAVRSARDGEISYEKAQEIAVQSARSAFPEGSVYAYPMLYDGHTSKDGAARYVVSCFAEPVAQILPDARVTVTLLASDGTVESVVSESAAAN